MAPGKLFKLPFRYKEKSRLPQRSGFLLLPAEIRDLMYDLVVEDAVVETPPLNQTQRLHCADNDKPDLTIIGAKVVFQNLRLPTNLFFANYQVHAELSAHVYKRIRHVRIAAGWLLPLQPTHIQPSLDVLAHRTWMLSEIQSLSIDIMPGYAGTMRQSGRYRRSSPQPPAIRPRSFGIREPRRSGHYVQDRPIITTRNVPCWCTRLIRLARMPLPREEIVLGKENVLQVLARIFEMFPAIKKIDVETETCTLFSLTLASFEETPFFAPGQGRGVLLGNPLDIKKISSMKQLSGVETCTVVYCKHGVNLTAWYSSTSGGNSETGKYQLLALVVGDCLTGREQESGGTNLISLLAT